MRFHVVSLPHTNTTKEYITCAYTQKVVNFCKMMMSLKHEVFLYGGSHNTAECTRFFPCVQSDIAPEDYLKYPFDVEAPHWKNMNNDVISHLGLHIQEKDFICVIAGICQKPIADAFPYHQTVEFGIGYSGVFSPYKVFESYAWMHTMYGQIYGAAAADGRFFDAVIPNYYDTTDFEFCEEKDDYFLYMGRLTERKGYKIAMDVCQYLGKRLILAGPRDPGVNITYGEYIGVAGKEDRSRLMGRAKAVFTPTLYIEPFCGVHVEAMLCGTPVLTTDFGAFTEYVEQGKQGYRCRMFSDFVKGAKTLDALNNPWAIRQYASRRFSIGHVKYQYENYFKQLLTLYGKGWYEMPADQKQMSHA